MAATRALPRQARAGQLGPRRDPTPPRLGLGLAERPHTRLLEEEGLFPDGLSYGLGDHRGCLEEGDLDLDRLGLHHLDVEHPADLGIIAERKANMALMAVDQPIEIGSMAPHASVRP